jgi:dTDP-4-amino-4,6-dideoxygalactose transaminase
VLLSENRSDSIKLLRENGILCDIHYPRVAADVYFELKQLPQVEFKMASRITNNAISVPISPWMDDSKVQRVIQALNEENILRTFLGEM